MTEDHSALPSIQTHLYPAFLCLQGKLCAVVGGGKVATRKVRSLLATGASIVVISPQLNPELQTLYSLSSISAIIKHYKTEYLDSAQIVFAATDNTEVNHCIAQDAHARGLWVNVADNPALSNFYVPATIQRSDLTVAISTGGRAPAFARYLREWLEQSLSETLGPTLAMIAEARPLILAQPQEAQASLWQSLLALHLETLIETAGYSFARERFEQWIEHLPL